jgi:hypothetical protein
MVCLNCSIGLAVYLNYHDRRLLDYQVHAGQDEQSVYDTVDRNIEAVVVSGADTVDLHCGYFSVHLEDIEDVEFGCVHEPVLYLWRGVDFVVDYGGCLLDCVSS